MSAEGDAGDGVKKIFDAVGYQKEYDENYGNKIPSIEDHMIAVPVTASQIQTFQGEVSPDRYEIQGVYRTGAHSVIYRAKDKETGRTVAIKKHEHYFPQESGDAKEIRDAEDRFRREAQILAKLNHPGIVDAYGFYFKEDDFRRKPYLVTELIEQDSLEEMLEQGKTFNEQDSKRVVLSVGVPIHYMHTVNGRPIIHRDLKPDNVKVMPEDAAWPHKIVDFSESKIGKATMSGSVTGTIGYNAPEIYGGGIADQSADFYSLMRIATHMLIGDNRKFMETWLGNTSLREMKENGDLNVSDQFLKAIERATSRDPSHRYKTVSELAQDLGYNFSQVPQTRQELETILEHKQLPARVEPEKPKEVDKEGNYSYIVRENEDGSVHIGYRNPESPDEPYCGNVFEGKTVYDIFRAINTNLLNMDSDKATLAYAQHVAHKHRAILDALEGRRSLEDALREKGPSILKHLLYKNAKASHLAKRKELYEVFGTEEKYFKFLDGAGAGLGLIGGMMSGIISTFALFPKDASIEIVPWILGNLALGTIAGSNIQRHYENKKLKKQAREVDSWIKEARRAQKPGEIIEALRPLSLPEPKPLLERGTHIGMKN